MSQHREICLSHVRHWAFIPKHSSAQSWCPDLLPPSLFHTKTNLKGYNALKLLMQSKQRTGYYIVCIKGVRIFSAVIHLYKPKDHIYESLRANTFDQWRISPKLNDSPTEKSPSAVSLFLWWSCPGPSQEYSLMLAYLLGHVKRSSILKCTWKLTLANSE